MNVTHVSFFHHPLLKQRIKTEIIAVLLLYICCVGHGKSSGQSFIFTFCIDKKTLHEETILCDCVRFAVRITDLAQQTDQKHFSAIFRSL